MRSTVFSSLQINLQDDDEAKSFCFLILYTNFPTKIHVLSASVFLQFRLSRIQILVDMTGKTKGKLFKSNAILSNPSTLSSSKCERSILLQGGSVRRCENTSISGLPSIRPSVLEYLERSNETQSFKKTLFAPNIRFHQKTYLVSTIRLVIYEYFFALVFYQHPVWFISL